jgi:hypothetical protein
MTTQHEKIGGGLEFVIGPRVNWLGLLTGLLLVSIVFGVGIAPTWDGLLSAIHSGQSAAGYIAGLLALCALLVFLVVLLVLNLFGSEQIIVDSKDLEIRLLIFGYQRSERSFPNSTVENLRYEEWPGPRGAGMQHGLRFECVGETVTFAFAASTAEAYDILDQMQMVYAFPTVNQDDLGDSPAVTKW